MYTAVFVESIVCRDLNGLKLSVSVAAEIVHTVTQTHTDRQMLMCQRKQKASIIHRHTHLTSEYSKTGLHIYTHSVDRGGKGGLLCDYS